MIYQVYLDGQRRGVFASHSAPPARTRAPIILLIISISISSSSSSSSN